MYNQMENAQFSHDMYAYTSREKNCAYNSLQLRIRLFRDAQCTISHACIHRPTKTENARQSNPTKWTHFLKCKLCILKDFNLLHIGYPRVMTKVNLSATVGGNVCNSGEMSATVGVMSAKVGKLNML